MTGYSEEGISMFDMFGADVFSDEVMQQRLPKRIYNSLKATIETGSDLDKDIAEVVAAAMKDWAIERGATHFAHWFQPMTGMTAEKHESFLEPTGNGRAITEFSSNNLVKGEPDASSFPSGGLRETFEARGYTSWDPSSPAFIKDKSLYIPSVFFSYTGNVLDKKTPLLRSMNSINQEGLRIMRLFGDETTRQVIAYMGAEQEYFLVPLEHYRKRKDLFICGRTLFGAPAPKGQEFEDHYFSAINERVAGFMQELDESLWRLGVPAKIKHSEVAPGQFELVPVFNTCNVANDQNQLVMACMNNIAPHHGLACLLSEKPFKGVNGSGKHINWSIGTDDGKNLLVPGDTAKENARFLLFLCAMLHAVDTYPELLRAVISSSGNDLRLGGDEAPPTILSIFIGDEMLDILEEIEKGRDYNTVDKGVMELGVNILPKLPKDISDRNRTSPFAYTGNKFEFRMPGASSSTAGPNIALNTAYADVLGQYADRLEKADHFWDELSLLIVEEIRSHKRVVFNGNNYSDEWVEEAKRRGLPVIEQAVDAFIQYNSEKNAVLFTNHKIYTQEELDSRREIHLLEYSRRINIEALTMVEMANKNIIPDVLRYEKLLLSILRDKKDLHLNVSESAEYYLLTELSGCLNAFRSAVIKLDHAIGSAQASQDDLTACAYSYQDQVSEQMKIVRELGDRLEVLCDESVWSMPSYTALLLEG
ncbi:glutamine synthetase III [Peptococcus niger]|uniref:L-glutamine synthetase n=1 Tax=Peptococcus niger TaxID=2741 RepID=A0A1G6UL43_PEPNI|nr:glutamine synthetase III [Peptococcus niger]SDD41974.1 L-glutamine synthetase [Peptococcus niger]